MSNETIRPGDLVMVVRPTYCCNVVDSVGKIFVVDRIYSGKVRCVYCRTVLYINASARTSGKGVCDIPRLKKLNPPAKQETTGKEKEMV